MNTRYHENMIQVMYFYENIYIYIIPIYEWKIGGFLVDFTADMLPNVQADW